jgi:hypothetical protein
MSKYMWLRMGRNLVQTLYLFMAPRTLLSAKTRTSMVLKVGIIVVLITLSQPFYGMANIWRRI